MIACSSYIVSYYIALRILSLPNVRLDFFITGPSTLIFTSNGTQNILIFIADDTEDEPDETFSIALVNPVSGATVIVSPDTITITIVDNDDVTPTGKHTPRPRLF